MKIGSVCILFVILLGRYFYVVRVESPGLSILSPFEKPESSTILLTTECWRTTPFETPCLSAGFTMNGDRTKSQMILSQKTKSQKRKVKCKKSKRIKVNWQEVKTDKSQNDKKSKAKSQNNKKSTRRKNQKCKRSKVESQKDKSQMAKGRKR